MPKYGKFRPNQNIEQDEKDKDNALFIDAIDRAAARLNAVGETPVDKAGKPMEMKKKPEDEDSKAFIKRFMAE